MLTKGQAFTCTDADAGQQFDEDGYRERVVKSLTQRGHTLGFQRVPCHCTSLIKNQACCHASGMFLETFRKRTFLWPPTFFVGTLSAW